MLPEQLDGMLEHVRSIAGCDRAGLWIRGDGHRFEALTLVGNKQPPASSTAIERAANSDTGVFCSDTRGALALARSESISSGGIRALFAIPVRGSAGTNTVLYADSHEPGKLFRQLDADLLHAAARQIALSLDSLHVRRQIDKLKSGAG